MTPSRREILLGAASLPLLASGAVAATADELWPEWQAEWRRMEGVARARNWTVTPLRIDPPVNSLRLRAIELEIGLPFPAQLRELMLRFSGRVAFGWSIPSHLMPFEAQRLPTSSSFRNLAWDIGHMVEMGIPNFLGWKRDLKDRDLSEAPNRPEMWENQFPIADVINGDMVTIDVSKPDGPQPVRYFSHELEGVHGIALAPDFFTFVTVLSKLGWAGSEQDSWFPFMFPQKGDTRYLSTETEGARNWSAWLAQDPANPPPDEPPMATAAETSAERALLKAAETGAPGGVRAALAAGARPDVVRHGDDLLEMGKWEWEFATALSHAVRRDDLETAELLAGRGANPNTRRLAVNDAVARGSLETLRWTIQRGGRARGWRYDRYHPIHTLLAVRAGETVDGVAEQKRNWEKIEEDLRKTGAYSGGIKPDFPRPVDEPTILAMLDLLIEAGADLDAPWDNRITMLMWTKSIPVAKRLLVAKARVDLTDHSGQTVMHWAQSSTKARLLVAAGADINRLSTPLKGDETYTPVTPLQWQLVGNSRREPDMIETLLELGADPTIRDGNGRSTLAWCYSVADFERMRGFGLDPKERGPQGETQLVHLMRRGGLPRVKRDLALIDHLLSLGIGINEQDKSGQTMLHALAERELAQPEDVGLLLARGADKTLRDAQGRTPYDVARKSDADLRRALQ